MKKNILVTRPSPQADELCRLIAELGHHAIHLPVIAFAAPPDQEAYSAVIKQLGEQDWLIFISPQAVYASTSDLRKHWPHLPESVKFAAIGSGTAKALEEAGFNPQVYPKEDANTESLLALPEFQQVAGKKITIVRGVGGRELVDKILAERGARILPWFVYERILPKVEVDGCLAQLRQHKIDIIVCTSFESVRNLKILLGDSAWPYISELPLIVMSERIKVLAGDLGFRRIWVASNASTMGILETIQRIR